MDSEIVIVMGYPAAGKTSLMSQFSSYERLNRDLVGGTLEDLAAEMEKRIHRGKKKFVLDNTYGTKKSRQQVIEVGKRNKIPVCCLWLQTSIEDAQVNVCQRMIEKHGKILSPEEITASRDPNMFSPVVLFGFKKTFETPDISEGFEKIEKLPFVRKISPAKTNKAVIVDYDGTLRKTKAGSDHEFPIDVNDIEILPGRSEVLKKYKKNGYKILGASNQSGIAKGDLTDAMAKACFEYTNKLLGIDIEYSYCPHSITGKGIECFCRKPMPGQLIQFIEKHQLDRTQTIFVGDMTTDKTCATRAGVRYMDQAEFFK